MSRFMLDISYITNDASYNTEYFIKMQVFFWLDKSLIDWDWRLFIRVTEMLLPPTNSPQSTQLLQQQHKRRKKWVIGFASVNFAAADGDLSTRYFRLISVFGQICYTIRKAVQTPIISRIHSFWKRRKLSKTKIKV